MKHDPIVIVSAARTPMGGFQGSMSGFTAGELGAHAIQQAVLRAGHPTLSEKVDEVIMGCVLPAGQGQAPARQAALTAGLPLSSACTTINKMCGSGMKAIMMAHDSLLAGSTQVAVAGGMESMSNAPYLLPKARSGMRMGHGQVMDHMFLDGLEDAYDKGRLMGSFAEECADQYRFTRQAQDEFAIRSLERAKQATEDGSFQWEIAPIEVASRKGTEVVSTDEQPLKADPAKIPTLKPAFRRDGGTVTAANSSSISDGAAAVVMMKQSHAEKLGIKPLARILGHSTHAQKPSLFTTAPVGALQGLFEKIGLNAAQVDLFEINEAFAVVTMAAMADLNLPADKVNIHGGACALGHPIGASGARIVCTLIGALKKTNGKIGVASLCIGGGEATALAIELI
ncbi:MULTISPECIES: acetyl-CoA C-acetyltransferase [unclassified Limnobacter]|jgi:acetyl-CoA C-acetyltransferase|uniref:acetyl-CoA C-acetyltransferase n=1 Tax=unclassified Limnobacter TaxID=2630203 RepID=UPI000C5AC67B|nr:MULTISPECIES: acetyl-CoA C-acetyltransferase [unclassified Limnobacter]MAG80960.1 acetyl-CoA C-acyltransferase [Sutterellaceae bacterium]MBA4314451.1 acetyl-CoA C-acyltransferase [Alcaligenaceae bacterium]PZO19238.1 MAG: acetyl-CoA C-acetyltransferase [Betaproteobacteria bacterium]HAV73668.1 acetyl-CoA C-acetyltransferase [Limnobacter sp.]MBT84296.1 acetyl-CoA C-acyltransferase [Sutterellaceae bacterium]|tara:strand:+ start:824 stop:2017 length:1194 start_codon:yes stop_codon:yes gene_type:complete